MGKKILTQPAQPKRKFLCFNLSLRVLEWDGKNFRDVTIAVDQKIGYITAKSKHFKDYIIVDLPHQFGRIKRLE